MKHPGLILTIFILFSFNLTYGQNLVPNPSFENLGTPSCLWMAGPANFGAAVYDWYLPTLGSSDIFTMLVDSSCVMHCFSTSPQNMGHQQPKSGVSMAGIINYNKGNSHREYLAIRLKEPMVVGGRYYVEMYVSHADRCRLACNNMGMLFSEKIIQQYSSVGPIYRSPQINETEVIEEKVDWLWIGGTVLADSAYEYLHIGNFHSNANSTIIDYYPNLALGSAYYFVDDISVEACGRILGGDTVVCGMESLSLKARSGLPVSWAEAGSPSVILSTDTFLTVQYAHTATYLLYTLCDTQQVKVDVYPPFFDLGRDSSVCSGDSVFLDAYYPGATYFWDNGSDSSIRVITTPGTYWVEVSTDFCTQTDTIVFEEHSFSLGNDTSICANDNFLLNAFIPGATYRWQDNSNFSEMEINSAGVYWVEIQRGSCYLSDTIEVEEATRCDVLLEMPNVFTPNGDGNNDVFRAVEIQHVAQWHLRIYNRWGKLVYESDNPAGGWDGTYNNSECSAGTYFYIVDYSDMDSNESVMNGSLSLFR